MRLDGPRAEHKAGRDLPVGQPFCRHPGDALLGWSQCVWAGADGLARAQPGGHEFVVSAAGERRRAAGASDLQTLSERLAGVGRPTGAAHRTAKCNQRLSVLELGLRSRQDRDGFAQQPNPVAASVDLPGDAERDAERARQAQRSRELQPALGMLGGESAIIHRQGGECRGRTPRQEGGMLDAEHSPVHRAG
jgi:hypothetical protein